MSARRLPPVAGFSAIQLVSCSCSGSGGSRRVVSRLAARSIVSRRAVCSRKAGSGLPPYHLEGFGLRGGVPRGVCGGDLQRVLAEGEPSAVVGQAVRARVVAEAGL